MKKEYILQGLDCANCASKIEQAVKKADGVLDASVNFIKGSLRIEWQQNYPLATLKTVDSIVRKVESGIKIIEKTNLQSENHHSHDKKRCDSHQNHHSHDKKCCENHSHSHSSKEKSEKNRGFGFDALYIRLIIGAIIFAVGLILEHLVKLESVFVTIVFLASYVLLGGDVLLKAFKNIIRGRVFDENFLMALATVGAFIIGEYAEGVGVMLFYQVGELFQELAVKRAKKSITSLMDIRPDYANLKSGDSTTRVSPESVQIGDMIVVKTGEKIPLDGIVVEGEAMLDTAALTGESVPRKAKEGDEVLSGSVNQNGLLSIRVGKTFGESTVSKIIDLVENASDKKAPTENFITKFARFYTPVVVILALFIAAIPPLFIGMSSWSVWMDWIRRGLIFLVISCPCALVISIPLGFFGGIGGASKKGVLIKGGNYLEALNSLDIVVFDKTGTLTKGVFNVTQLLPAENVSKDELLFLAAKAEAYSLHPIAKSIMNQYAKPIDKSMLKDYSEIAGHGICVSDGGKMILAGNAKFMERENIAYKQNATVGTKVYVAADGKYVGCIVISDEVKSDAKQFVSSLKEKGVRTVMLTGDNPDIAIAVANSLGIDEVYGGLLPQQKVEKVEWLNSQKRKGGKLVFMGDGINDAPVLALSDIGVSMGGLGSDAAIEAADIVIMTDEPSKLNEAISVAKFTRRVVWQNIVFALAIKAAFLLLGAFSLATMWEAVFADVGVALLAILNALRIMNK